MGQVHSLYNGLSFLTGRLLSIFGIQRLLFGGNKLLFEESKSEDTAVHLPKTTFQSLPVEIILHIFSHLELQPYLFSRGVCKEWLRLLPLADIHPARRRLIYLYLKMVNTPDFINTRTWIVDKLLPFDRQAYIDSLLCQYPAIPEEFRIWLLEWPERATIDCTWPGLPFVSCNDIIPSKRSGVNWMAYKRHSPQLLAPVYRQCTPFAKFVPGLLIWRQSGLTDWLIFDKDEPEVFGRVYITDLVEFEDPAVIPHERQKMLDDDDDPIPISVSPGSDEEDNEFREDHSHELEGAGDKDTEGYLNVPHPDWVAYLESCWAENDIRLQYHGVPNLINDYLIPESQVTTEFNGSCVTTLPAVPWSLRERYTEYLTKF
ncbi:hypothetical protein JR316_0001476 [Psilocybe cubensis]|uniref:Uncharacterized protein n=2 Tax=Psilocybe cubensis TaxID=181762 RepID=A0ACB8HHI9_PSICU|nr:hypothetical protein JR316_0001476 [Psilocybe cubensis]KAH9487401.1 hypothetical protein JR316_0001476 [Psilocybe cubensis]